MTERLNWTDNIYICTHTHTHTHTLNFPGGSDSKESAYNAGDPLGWEDSSGEGNGYPLQYSYLENLMDREAWWATVHGVEKSWP